MMIDKVEVTPYGVVIRQERPGTLPDLTLEIVQTDDGSFLLHFSGCGNQTVAAHQLSENQIEVKLKYRT